MSDQTPVHDYLRPRIAALVRDAVAQGMPPDVVTAVLMDIISSPAFNAAAPDSKDDSAPHPDWDRSQPGVVLVTDGVTANVPTIGVHAEDDFIAPLTIHD